LLFSVVAAGTPLQQKWVQQAEAPNHLVQDPSYSSPQHNLKEQHPCHHKRTSMGNYASNQYKSTEGATTE